MAAFGQTWYCRSQEFYILITGSQKRLGFHTRQSLSTRNPQSTPIQRQHTSSNKVTPIPTRPHCLIILPTMGHAYWNHHSTRESESRPPPAPLESKTLAFNWCIGNNHDANVFLWVHALVYCVPFAFLLKSEYRTGVSLEVQGPSSVMVGTLQWLMVGLWASAPRAPLHNGAFCLLKNCNFQELITFMSCNKWVSL